MLKPNILVCGPAISSNQFLISRVVKPGSYQDDGIYRIENKTPEEMVFKATEFPFANIIETKNIFGPEPDIELPPGTTMKEFVEDVEREIRNRRLLSNADGRIDAVWYVTNGDRDSFTEQEREFIHSAMELPNATLVGSIGCSVITREDLVATVDALTDIIAPDRIVLVDSGYYGQEIDAKWRLIESTKQKFVESGVLDSEEEKQEYEAVWTEYYEPFLQSNRARSEKSIEKCIEHAAGRASYIVEEEDSEYVAGLIQEGCALLKDIFRRLKGKSDLKKDVTHTAELLDNIIVMIYELAGCCGTVAVKDDVNAILRGNQVSDLPDDAAAITYAVGMAAKAYFESGRTIPRQEIKDIFANAKEEGLDQFFIPMCEDDPATMFMFDDDDDDDDLDRDFSGNNGSNGSNGDDGDDGDDDFEEEVDEILDELQNRLDEKKRLLKNLKSNSVEDEIMETDYGNGHVVTASGSRPDSCDNASGKRFRLPDDHTPPGVVLETDMVGGGWGYTIQDATIIKGGIPNEKLFIEDRVMEELSHMEETGGEEYAFTGYQKYAHELVRDGNDAYDHLFVQIEIVPEADWDELEEDWEAHDGYENDKKGRLKHEKWEDSKTIRFTEHFWFNINDFFSFGEDGDFDDPEIDE